VRPGPALGSGTDGGTVTRRSRSPPGFALHYGSMASPPRPEPDASNEQKLSRYLTLARRAARRWPLGVAVCLLVTAISVGVALSKARIYRSECLIYYKEEMRKDMLSDREAERERDLAHKLHQLLWSRTRLLKIIKSFNLYPDLRAAKTEEEVVETMRNAIEVREKGGDTFWVAYEGKDPKTVQAVTQRLADTFVEENAREAVERSRATSEFIERETGKAKAELGKAAAELTRFYQEHPELIPEGTQDSRTPGAAVRALGKAARSAAKRPRYVIKGASPEVRALLTEKGRLEAQLSLASQPRSTGPSERETDLAEARRELASLRARFSEDYPDVSRARARVQRLEALVARERKGGGNAESVRLRGEIARLDAEIARLTPKSRRVEVKDSDPGRSKEPIVSATERVETEYTRLVQAYEVAKARASALSDKQLQARVLSNLEATQQSATFRIVDPAYLPEKAIRPSRRKIVMMGAFLGFFLGLAALGARVFLDPRIYDETDLIDLTGLPLLAQVPRDGGKTRA
jgi:succinoglycan biosynthesis transport protein ExoP